MWRAVGVKFPMSACIHTLANLPSRSGNEMAEVLAEVSDLIHRDPPCANLFNFSQFPELELETADGRKEPIMKRTCLIANT
jgi:hypothetical protein